MGQTAPVRVPVSFWNDGRVERLPQRLRSRPSEDVFGLCVPLGNDAIGIRADDGIQRRVNGQAQPALAFLNSLRLLARGRRCLGILRRKLLQLSP